MRVMLEFSLPEENTEYNNAKHGTDLATVLWSLQGWLTRMRDKTGLRTESDAFAMVLSEMDRQVRAHGLSMEELA